MLAVKGGLTAEADDCTFDEIWALAVKGGLAVGADVCTLDET